MYQKKVIDHAQNPEFAGELANPDSVGEVGNMKCGDMMRIFIKVKNNIIKDIKFQTYGCMPAIASSDVICKLAKGKSLDDALKITFKDIINELGDLPAIKYHCSVLGTQALKKAIENYKKEHKN